MCLNFIYTAESNLHIINRHIFPAVSKAFGFASRQHVQQQLSSKLLYAIIFFIMITFEFLGCYEVMKRYFNR